MKRTFLISAMLVFFTSFLIAQDRISTANFTKIEVRNAFNVILVPSDKNEVVVPKDLILPEGLTANDIVIVSGSTLTIAIPTVQNIRRNIRGNNNKKQPYMTIYFKSLESLQLSGAVNAKSEGTIRASSLKLRLSGASDAKLDVIVNELTTVVSGASDVILKGRVNVHNITASGSSDVWAKNLNANRTEVQLSGSSDARISSLTVTGKASGASDLKVNSNADVNVRTSGASGVKRY
jgi:formylmethanofuran dehydrogenase subunit D